MQTIPMVHVIHNTMLQVTKRISHGLTFQKIDYYERRADLQMIQKLREIYSWIKV